MSFTQNDIIDIQYSRKIIPQVGFICGTLFLVSGFVGVLTMSKLFITKSDTSNTKVYIASSGLLIVSGLYLINFFKEYNKQV